MARNSAPRSRRATSNAEQVLRPENEGGLRCRFQFRVEVGDDVFKSRNRLLNRGDLHQLPAADRADAVLQCDDQIPPLFLQLNKRQTVVGQTSHDVFHPLHWTCIGNTLAGLVCDPLTEVGQILANCEGTLDAQSQATADGAPTIAPKSAWLTQLVAQSLMWR